MASRHFHSALDNDTLFAINKFLDRGVPPDVSSLYSTLQRSNSPLKRQRKATILASIKRALDHLQPEHDPNPDPTPDPGSKSEPEPEPGLKTNPRAQCRVDMSSQKHSPSDLLNQSLRSNLAGRPAPETKKRKLEEQEEKSAQQPMRSSVKISMSDLKGMDEAVNTLVQHTLHAIYEPSFFHDGEDGPPNGILLHGPPGCGKTTLARALAAEYDVPLIEILGPSLVSSMSGESERAIRDRFAEAKHNAPCFILLDGIDSIANYQGSSGSSMENRMSRQVQVCMDELNRDTDSFVMVLATTNSPDNLDPTLRSSGRFAIEVLIPAPNKAARKEILKHLTRHMRLSPNVDFDQLAVQTAGFTGSDLSELVKEVKLKKDFDYMIPLIKDPANDDQPPRSLLPLIRMYQQIDRTPVGQSVFDMPNFQTQISIITPTLKRQGFTTTPSLSWNDIGALDAVRDKLKATVVDAIHPTQSRTDLGIPSCSGVLLWGPPGCGKTLLAKAIVAETQASFIYVRGPELHSKYLGDSEAAVRKVFERARKSLPCVVFFDEIDSLAPTRNSSGNEASARLVNTLLLELDGVDERAGIHVIGATNRMDILDPALLRPGRLSPCIFVDLPNAQGRVEIFKALTRNRPCPITTEVEQLLKESCNEFSGADLKDLYEDAATHALGRRDNVVRLHDIQKALPGIRRSVSTESRAKYQQMAAEFAAK